MGLHVGSLRIRQPVDEGGILYQMIYHNSTRRRRDKLKYMVGYIWTGMRALFRNRF
jgi:hypothetical protein